MIDPKPVPEAAEAESLEVPPPDSEAVAQAEAVEADTTQLEAALREAGEQVANYKDTMLRMQAEMENLRKRMARDLDRSRKLALEAIISDLLPVRDSLERGLEAAGDAGSLEALREGKALTMKMLNKIMQDHGVEELDPRGEAFNPELHEAVSMLPSAEVEQGRVLDVVQKGYRLHDRLIRPARVVVSRGPEGD